MGENPRISTKQEDHTVHLGRMLRVNTSISEIYLGKCKFRDEGIRQLVSFLMENKTLRVLDLRCNEIGADGASHLGTLLGSDCQLSLLNLSSNHNQWDQESSFKFHKLLANRARILPLRMDFVTSEVDFKIDICKVWDFTLTL